MARNYTSVDSIAGCRGIYLSGCDGADYLTLPSFNLLAFVLCTVKNCRGKIGERTLAIFVSV